MKRILILTGAVLAAVNLYAQGVVTFANSATLSPVIDIYTGQKIVAGSTFQAALFYAPDSATAPDMDAMVRIGGPANFGPSAGAYSGGGRTTPASTAPGAYAWFQVRVWETAYGATYDEVMAGTIFINGRLGKAGASNIFRSPTGNPPLLPAVVLANSGLQTMYVGIPEPSSLVLGLLGAGALFLVRRRRS